MRSSSWGPEERVRAREWERGRERVRERVRKREREREREREKEKETGIQDNVALHAELETFASLR